MERGAERAIVLGVTKSWTQLKYPNMHTNFKYQVPISMAQTYSEMTTSTVTEIFPRVAPTGRKDVPKDLFPKPRYLLQHDCLDRNAVLGDTFSGDDWIPRPHPMLSDMYEHTAAQMVNARGFSECVCSVTSDSLQPHRLP